MKYLSLYWFVLTATMQCVWAQKTRRRKADAARFHCRFIVTCVSDPLQPLAVKATLCLGDFGQFHATTAKRQQTVRHEFLLLQNGQLLIIGKGSCQDVRQRSSQTLRMACKAEESGNMKLDSLQKKARAVCPRLVSQSV
ncbi:hypothetical protein MZE56_024215 [Rahnella perminowiae]|nr:hypothetical protein [Rahnella perminowiae]